jgi:hypothetical protein
MEEWLYRSSYSWPRHYLDASCQLHAPAAFPPGETARGTYWIGGWMSPRTAVDDVVRRKFLTLPGLELRPLGRPPPNQSLSRLSEATGGWRKWHNEGLHNVYSSHNIIRMMKWRKMGWAGFSARVGKKNIWWKVQVGKSERILGWSRHRWDGDDIKYMS